MLPPLAANDVARLLTDNIKRPDGKDATAFNAQRDGLIAMKSSVEDLMTRVAALEAQPQLPFPFRGSFTPPGG